MLKTEFKYNLSTNTQILVEAKCDEVEGYDAKGLTLKFMDLDGNPLEVCYEKHVFDDIEYEATERLLEVKYTDELNFEEDTYVGI